MGSFVAKLKKTVTLFRTLHSLHHWQDSVFMNTDLEIHSLTAATIKVVLWNNLRWN